MSILVPPAEIGLPAPPAFSLERRCLLWAVLDLAAATRETPSVGEIATRAGVSRDVFRLLFDDAEACLNAAFGLLSDNLLACVRRAVDQQADAPWQVRLRTGMATCLRVLAANRPLGQLVFDHFLGNDPRSRRRWVSVRDGWVDYVRAEFDQVGYQGTGLSRPSETSLCLAVGAIFEMARLLIEPGGVAVPEDVLDISLAVLMAVHDAQPAPARPRLRLVRHVAVH